MEPEVRRSPVRYYEIDLLRFIAASSVVLFHFTYRGYHSDRLSPVEYPRLGEIFKYGHLGVELFFIISGYVVLMSTQGKSLSQFFTSRVMRLYPAYWVACTITFLVVWLFGPAVNTPGWSPVLNTSVKDYLFNMTMLQSFFNIGHIDGVYWTLTVELVFYFLISLLISFKWLKHLPLTLTVWLFYCALVGPAVNAGPFSFLLFPRFAPFFIAGMAFYLLQNNQSSQWKIYCILLIAYLLALRSARASLEETINAFQQPFSLVATLLIISVFFIVFLLVAKRKFKLKQSNWLVWAGALTYPMYLLHHNIGYIILQQLGGHVNKYTLLAGMCIGVLLLAYLLHTIIERRFSKLLGQKISTLLANA